MWGLSFHSFTVMLEGHENDHKTLWFTHLGHGLLIKGEGDVGAAVVLVTGARVAFAGRWGEVWAFAKVWTRLHKAVALSDGDAGLAWRTPASTFGAYITWGRPTPHLERKQRMMRYTGDIISFHSKDVGVFLSQTSLSSTTYPTILHTKSENNNNNNY